LKRERWGSPLVQEKYQEEKACDKRHTYRIIIIIIIIIIILAIRFRSMPKYREMKKNTLTSEEIKEVKGRCFI